MAVLGGDAVLSATTAGKSSETAGWEHEARGGDGRNRGENRASLVNDALSVRQVVLYVRCRSVRSGHCNYA